METRTTSFHDLFVGKLVTERKELLKEAGSRSRVHDPPERQNRRANPWTRRYPTFITMGCRPGRKRLAGRRRSTEANGRECLSIHGRQVRGCSPPAAIELFVNSLPIERIPPHFQTPPLQLRFENKLQFHFLILMTPVQGIQLKVEDNHVKLT